MHLSYIQNSKLDNSKAKEDISKSTAISIPKKINNHRFAHKSASSNNSKLNGSVEIAFSNKTTRPNNIKQKDNAELLADKRKFIEEIRKFRKSDLTNSDEIKLTLWQKIKKTLGF